MKRSNKKASGDGLIVAGVFCLILAIVLSCIGLQKPTELKEAGEISPEEMTDSYAYHFDELTVIDFYMKQSGAESGNGRYYIASFYDSGVYYLVSVYADNDEELRAKLKEYADDDEAYAGDLVLSGCFSAKKVTDVDGMCEFYDKTARFYAGQYNEYMNVDAVDLRLHLDYVCEEAGDYEDAASDIDLFYCGIIFLVLGVACLFFGIRLRKKGLAEIAALRELDLSRQQNEP